MCQAGSQETSPSRPASVPGSFAQVQSMPGPEVLHILRDPAAYQRLAQDILQASSSYQVCPAWMSMAACVDKQQVLSVVCSSLRPAFGPQDSIGELPCMSGCQHSMLWRTTQ